jgi:excisionase family DNA binding protein
MKDQRRRKIDKQTAADRLVSRLGIKKNQANTPRAARRAAADTLSVEDLAARLGIGRNQTYEAVRAGKIPSLRVGRRWLISRVVLDRMLSGDLQIGA